MLPPLLIVTPACGARSTARSLPRILARVEDVLGDVVILHTSRRGHARELAEEAAREGYRLIVAVGGDGLGGAVVGGGVAVAEAGGAVTVSTVGGAVIVSSRSAGASVGGGGPGLTATAKGGAI